jgi:cell division protein FtsL
MGALLNFILTVFIIVMAFRIFFLKILPWLLKRKIEKMQAGFTQEQAKQDSRKEGEVHFDKTKKQAHTVGKEEVGEYVDFEELN